MIFITSFVQTLDPDPESQINPDPDPYPCLKPVNFSYKVARL